METAFITDHLYDAGFPRNDSKGCIADSGIGTYGLSDCGQPLAAHAHSEYGDGRRDPGWYNPGDMHEPKPYTGELDWHSRIADRPTD